MNRARVISILVTGSVGAAGTLPSQKAAGQAGSPRAAVNLVTHSEVLITRPRSAVWPHIVDPNAWKQGAKLWHHAGPPGQVGEVFAAGDPANRAEVMFFVENVELVPSQRRTIKIYLPSGTLLGFASWWLREDRGSTTVGYDVFSETPLPAAPATGAAADSIRRAEQSDRAANQARFDAELRALKRVVEASP
jgi:hypothetical protein